MPGLAAAPDGAAASPCVRRADRDLLPAGRPSAAEIVRTQLKTDWPATLIAAAVFAAWTFVVVDAAGRSFEYISLYRHVAGALALYAMAGTVAGLFGSCVV